MKKITLLVLLITASFTLSVNAQLITNGLIAYYPFNGNANDLSGNNLNGTPTSPTLTTGHSGTVNHAYSFNGTSDYITVPSNNLLTPPTGISISAWVHPHGFYSGTDQGNYIISKGVTDGGEIGWAFYYQDQDGIPGSLDTTSEKFLSAIKFADGSQKGVISSTNTHTNNWYHLVMTYDGDTMKLFVNGVLEDTAMISKTMGTNTADMFIGRHYIPANPTAWPYYLNGIIDEVYIFDRAITTQEIQILNSEQLCNTLIPVSITNLNSTYTTNDIPVALIGTPAGGQFYGLGVYNNTFYPNMAGAGTHTIVYSYNNGSGCSNAICQDVSVTQALKVNENENNSSTLQIFPNPANGNFRLVFDSKNEKNIDVSIANINGQVVWSQDYTNNSKVFDRNINVASLTNGVYFVSVKSTNLQLTEKLIIAK